MSVDIIRSSPFERDLARILQYFLDQHAEDAGDRFLLQLDSTLAAIQANPGSGSGWESPHPRLQGIRYRQVKGFENFLVIYRVTPHGILIKRLFHGSQDIERALLGG